MPLPSETSTAIGRNLACARCGYNLRTLSPGDACPECGLLVADSVERDSLQTASPRWLAKQRWGVWIEFASYLLAAVAIVTEMYRGYLTGLSPAVMMALRVTPLVGISIAVWLLTTPRPNRSPHPAKRLVRYGFAAVLLLALVLPALKHAGNSMFGRVGWTLFFALLVVCWIGLGCIHARMARTLGRPALGLLLWAATVAWSIALLATAAFYVFREITERSLFSRAEPIYVNAVLVGGVLLVISSLLLAVAFTKPESVPAK